jgi:protein-arginine kinase activator protein McsA
MEYIISIFIAAVFFLIGKHYQKKMTDIRNQRFLKKHLESLDNLIDKLNKHQKPINDEDNIKLIESALKNAIEEERYEDASGLRDILEDLNKNNNEA